MKHEQGISMVQSIQARDISIGSLPQTFQLEISAPDDFFDEWQTNSVKILEQEKYQLDRIRLDGLIGLPQALTDMLSTPKSDKPLYSLLVNGREFVFIKVIHQPHPICTYSYALSINRGDDIIQVLKVLKLIKNNLL